jgi:hypothetical protein
VERDIQQLQIDARKQLAQSDAVGSGKPQRLTLIEARRQDVGRRAISDTWRCMNYTVKVKLSSRIADKVGIGAETISRWLNAPAFPERRIRSDRRRDQASFLQSCERGLQPSLTRTHYSAGRVSALLNMPPPSLLPAQKRHLEAFLRFCPKSHRLRRFILQFRAMMRWRSAKKLGAWIKAASTSGFHFLAQFANTLRRDLKRWNCRSRHPGAMVPLKDTSTG